MPVELALSRAQRIRNAATAFGPPLVISVITLSSVARGADWFDGLTLPSFAVPSWMFGIAQAVAGLVMGFAFDRVLCRPDWMPDRRAAICAFLVQAGLSALWPLAFFGLRSPGCGLIVMLGLLLTIGVSAQRFGRIDRRAGYCAWLCAGWASYAALVALSIVIRN